MSLKTKLRKLSKGSLPGRFYGNFNKSDAIPGMAILTVIFMFLAVLVLRFYL